MRPVEDIITALCRIRWLFVIVRNSSFAYKGRAFDVKEIGRELGIRYVLEGGVRKAANRVRITTQHHRCIEWQYRDRLARCTKVVSYLRYCGCVSRTAAIAVF